MGAAVAVLGVLKVIAMVILLFLLTTFLSSFRAGSTVLNAMDSRLCGILPIRAKGGASCPEL